jgi:hypothetical protein
LLAWGTVILSWLFFSYWILQWAALYSGVTLSSWAYQIIFVLIQDIFFNEMIQIFIVHILVLEALRPQLRQIYYALNTVVLNKMTNVTETDRIQGNKEYFRIIQHLSPACRAARRPECAELPSAQILMRVDDNDAAICMSNRNLNLGYVMSFLILIPTLLALSHETIQEGVMEVVLPTLFCCFILANDYLLAISPYLLAAPYAIVALYLIYRYGYLLPSRHRKLQEGALNKASTGMEEKVTHKSVDGAWRNMNLNLELNQELTPRRSPRASSQTFFGTIPEESNLGNDQDGSDEEGEDALHGLQFPESIENMRVHPTRFKHFKYQEKYRKKAAANYVNKHIWHSESKVPRASVVASEVKNMEQFFDAVPRTESRDSMTRRESQRNSLRFLKGLDDPFEELPHQPSRRQLPAPPLLRHRTATFTSDASGQESGVHSFHNEDLFDPNTSSSSPGPSPRSHSRVVTKEVSVNDFFSQKSKSHAGDFLPMSPRKQKKLTARDAWKLRDQHFSGDFGSAT